jgi:hypothetical protein
MIKLYTEEDKNAISKYERYELMYDNEHLKAFEKLINQYGVMFTNKSRLTEINVFALISTIWANLLFEEFPRIQDTMSEKNRLFIEKITQDSSFTAILYENAISSSYNGDCFIRIRSDENKRLYFDDIPASNVSIEYHEANPRLAPIAYHLHWYKKVEDKYYVLRETHKKGSIEYRAYELPSLQATEARTEAPLSIFSEKLQPIVETELDDFLVFHIKNVGKVGDIRGISDYRDVENLVWALENRFSRNDDILDRHGKPLLFVPTGTLYKQDPNTGQRVPINKDEVDVIEIDKDADERTNTDAVKYVTWDGQLEASRNQIDDLVEMIFMIAQIAPTLVGIDPRGGVPESGTALRYRILQTISRKHQKQRYWDKAIKDMLAVAIQFAFMNDLTYKDTTPDVPTSDIQITWYDGILKDELELVEVESRKVKEGFSTQVDSVAIINDMTPDEAKNYTEKINAEKKEKLEQQQFNLANMHPNQVENRSERRTDEQISEDES